MTNSHLPRKHFIWGTILSPDGPRHDYFRYFIAYTFQDFNFTPVIHPKLGSTLIYWEQTPYMPANRRANNFLRPVYRAHYVKFPKEGARGEALIRHGGGERHYILVPEEATSEEEREWVKQNLTSGADYCYDDSLGEWSLVLSDDENDHFKAKMRFG